MWKRRHPHLSDMARHFGEAVQSNSDLVSRIENISFAKEYHLPPVEYPIEIASKPVSEDEKLQDYVLDLVAQNGRFPGINDPRRNEYAARLRTELGVICDNGKVNFMPYFIALHDVCREARERGILMSPGRGSAAGSLLAYLLKITHLDPIFWGLSFPRFLSAGRINRGKLPDIDLDFGDPRIIADSLKEKYGERFARISTTNTLKPKNAIRDVCRVLLGTQENKQAADLVDAVCKSLSNPPQGMADMDKWLYGWEDGEGAHVGEVENNRLLAQFFEDHPEVQEGVNSILGIPRSLGRHASAYCLAEVNLSEYMPMCRIKDEECIQYTMGPVEEMGFVKMDFLGLNTLKDIAGCVSHIKNRRGVEIDIYNVPDCDPATFDNFCRGNNASVFQFNTDIGIDVCQKIRPRCIKDLSDITAAGRPGTMYALMDDGQTTLIDSWIRRRNGTERVRYVHDEMKPALEPTLGICIYQESLMKLFQDCCGFSEERADEIREIVGKKKRDQIDAILPEIRNTLAGRGWNPSQIESFISLIQAAGSYAFNRSHSLAYAYLGYVCQWLKTHYPLEWWTSVLQNSSMDDLKANARQCKEMVIPPNINTSDLDFYIIDNGQKIVFPLGMVRGVKKAAAEIVSKRPFDSFDDFYNRVDRSVVHKGTVAALIWAGAFDEICGIESISDRNGIYQRYIELRANKQDAPFVPAPAFQVLLNQNQSLPLNSADFSSTFADIAKIGSITGLSNIDNVKVGSIIHVVGCVSEVRQIKTKGGEDMAFVHIVDQSQSIAITVFPRDWSVASQKIKEGKIILAKVQAQEYMGKKTFLSKSEIKVYGEVNPDISDERASHEAPVGNR